MFTSTGDRLRALFLVSVGAAAPIVVSAAEGSSEPVLEEVVVTAQRREESAQSVAIAMTAISGDELNNKAITRFDDLQFAAPAITITDVGVSRSVNIRGIGLASGSPAVTVGVATYIDGLFQPPIVTSATYYDMSGVEVLRGPQGTLVGASSTGGAILINTRSPQLGQTEGYAQVSGGNYSAWGGQGAINVPLGDTFAMRFAGTHQRHDTYYTDLGPYHSQAGKLDESAGRVGFLWRPSDSFQALLKADLMDRDTGGYALRPIPGTTYAPLRSPSLRELSYDDPTWNDERATQTSLELRYTLANGVVLRSLGGFQNKRVLNLSDFDASIQPSPPPNPYPRVTDDQHIRERVWTQEINVISPTEGNFDWIVGGYFQRNRIDVVLANPSNGFPTDVDIHNRKIGRGYFAQVGYKITPALKLNVGARYSTYDVTQIGSVIVGRGIISPTGLRVADLAGGHDDSRPTGKVGLEWTLNESNLLYGFVARGYKPGGFNSATVQFDPETVVDYELGWKSTMAGGRLRTQFGVFYNDYTEFQVDVLNPVSGQLGPKNVANATNSGIEGQAQGKFGGWGFDIGASYLHTNLGKVQFVNIRALPPGTNLPQCPAGVSPVGTPPTCFDYTPYLTTTSKSTMLYAPEFTFNVGTDYTFPMGNGATLRPRLNYAYVSSQFINLLYSPLTDELPARGLLSAQLTYSRDAWMVEAYGTNLTNKDYVTGQFATSEMYGAPREYGVRASIHF